MVTSFWILSTRQKLPHTTVNIPTMFHEVWWKKPFLFLNPPFFLFPCQLRQSLSYRLRFILAYLIQLDVDVTGNITAKLCEVWSEFNIFCTLVTMATATILNFFNPPPPQKLLHTTVDIPTKFHEVWWKESKIILNPPFFVSMATAAKFVQLIPIFLAYLVPLAVDVVPIKFHQFLFGE